MGPTPERALTPRGYARTLEFYAVHVEAKDEHGENAMTAVEWLAHSRAAGAGAPRVPLERAGAHRDGGRIRRAARPLNAAPERVRARARDGRRSTRRPRRTV